MPAKKPQTLAHLDPRAPLVIDTRELGRRPGSMRRTSRTVPAPKGLGIPVLAVPAGEPVELDLRLEAVMEGVLVSGEAHTRVTGECVRCLDPVEQHLDVDFQELYAYPGEPLRSHVGPRGEDDEDDETLQLEGDLLDLEPVLRDALVLALPLQPVCSEDCPGLCQQCGLRLADEPDHTHDLVDARWQSLSRLLPDSAPDGRPNGSPNGSPNDNEKR